MYPKKRIQQLNLRRDLNRRLRFVKQRIGETVIEHHFFRGAIPTMPNGLRIPPPWARNAANEGWTRGFGAVFDRITPEEIQRDPRGAVREITAIHESLMAYISSPKLDEEIGEIGDTELAEIKKAIWPDVGKILLQNLKKLDARLDELLPPATHAQLIEYHSRELRATKAVGVGDELIFGGKTMTAKICYIIWFFWPELEAKRQMTAGDLHTWLKTALGIFASQKLVEAIFTRLRMSTGKVNPRST